jgi:hypothetical protein
LRTGGSVMAAAQSPPVAVPGTSAWDSEGGSLDLHNPTILPDGVIAVPVTHYRVGSYTYTNLDDAMAQYHRLNREITTEKGEHVSRN